MIVIYHQDESHTIKNFKTKSTQSATRLGEKAKRIVLLSGEINNFGLKENKH